MGLLFALNSRPRSFMWRQQHVVGHHAYTNVEGMDPDIRVSSSDVRRVAPSQPWHPWHTMQHAYLGVLYGLLAVKSIFVDGAHTWRILLPETLIGWILSQTSRLSWRDVSVPYGCFARRRPR